MNTLELFANDPQDAIPLEAGITLLRGHADSRGLMPLIERTLSGVRLIYCRTCDEGYVNPGPLVHSSGEFSIELVAQKVRT